MSLINKMLQDLDARGGRAGPDAASPEVKPVPPPERVFPWRRVALLGGLLAVLGGSAYMAWRMKPSEPAEVPISLADSSARATGGVSPPGPAPAAAPTAAAMPPRETLLETSAEASAPQSEEQAIAEPVPDEQPARAARPAVPVQQPAGAAPRTMPPDEGGPLAPARPAARAAAVPQPPASTSKRAASKAAAGAGVDKSARRAEDDYRRALASLEDGRVTEAIVRLQAALEADPRHEASRQTLVSLLIEAKRPEEAMRELGAALALDPRQPAVAMLMARLQLERGGPGIDTLMRTLPYAAGNAEYHAFLAAALAREKRHREAVEQYESALRVSPQNGIWWMGMGISLQAEKRSPEAAAAYRKALDSGTLSAELQGFVERRIKQLNRQDPPG